MSEVNTKTNYHQRILANDVDVLYNYIHYKKAIKMHFYVETGIYKIQLGWLQKVEEKIIIGEANGMFVERLMLSVGCIEGKNDYKKEFYLPIGIHKSRLLKTLPGQLWQK